MAKEETSFINVLLVSLSGPNPPAGRESDVSQKYKTNHVTGGNQQWGYFTITINMKGRRQDTLGIPSKDTMQQ